MFLARFVRRHFWRWTGIILTVLLLRMSLSSVMQASMFWRENDAEVSTSDVLERLSLRSHENLGSRMAKHGPNNFLLVPAVQPYRIVVEPQVESPDHKFVIFVQSSSRNVEKRKLIRQTWADPQFLAKFNLSYKPFVFFSFGFPKNITAVNLTSLEQETKLNDILLLDFVDDYDNLTLKGLLTMHWINNTFPSAWYVFKTDDDVLVNLYSWTSIIQTLESRNMVCSVVGLVWKGSPALREGRYKLSQEQYFPEHLPSFCSGMGYLMSRGSMKAIMEVSKYYPLLIRDDPYFTGLVAEKAKVALYNIDRVDFYQVFAFHFNISMISKRTVLIHNATEKQWWAAWDKLKTIYSLKSSEDETLKITFFQARMKQRNETGYYALTESLPGECSRGNKTPVPKKVIIVL